MSFLYWLYRFVTYWKCTKLAVQNSPPPLQRWSLCRVKMRTKRKKIGKYKQSIATNDIVLKDIYSNKLENQTKSSLHFISIIRIVFLNIIALTLAATPWSIMLIERSGQIE
ncbi:hypothetical protein Lal_00027620, partial [Lupinus albus]